MAEPEPGLEVLEQELALVVVGQELGPAVEQALRLGAAERPLEVQQELPLEVQQERPLEVVEQQPVQE